MTPRAPLRPAGFKPVVGELDYAFLSDTPPSFIKRSRYTGRRAEGVRYERKAQVMLKERYGQPYIPSPWLCFSEDGRVRWCQPDGLLLYPRLNRGIILEIKYSHTPRAWWQVRKLYTPVLQKLMPGIEFRACEIVKWFDPAVVFPEPTAFTDDPALMGADAFGIHIWTP